MKKSTGIALGAAAVVGAYFLNQKLNPPKLIVKNMDRPNKEAIIEFDGTSATVGVNKQVSIPGRNGKTLKAYANDARTAVKLDLYKDGEYFSSMGRIDFS